MARTYKRDSRGRFASGGSASGGRKGATSKQPAAPVRKVGTPPPKRRGLVTQRQAVAKARAKLATKQSDPSASPRSRAAQKGAVTKAKKQLQAAKERGRIKLKGKGDTIRPGKGGSKKASSTVKTLSRAERARAIKRAVERKGTVSGRRFEDGRSVSTMSLKELRTAVRQHARSAGIKTKSEFELMYAMAAGITKKTPSGALAGRQPRTRSDWERIYRDSIGVPQSERNRKAGPGIFRGIDIHTNSRARYVFDLKPGAGRDEINQAYRRLAKRAHPDAGGRAKDLARLTQMRDSLLAQLPQPKPKRSRKAKGAAASAPRSSGRRALPPGR